MVLASFGIDKSEDDLIYACGFLQPGGFYRDDLVKAAKDLGFPRTFKASPTIEELRSLVDGGAYPIVWIRAPAGVVHAMVVLEVETEYVRVHDPAEKSGGLQIPRAIFEDEWRGMHRWAVIIRK